MANFILEVIQAIMDGPEGSDYASMTIAGLDPLEPTKIYDPDPTAKVPLFAERAFQYWPESINDSIEIGWDIKSVGGGSHGLAQWTSNNGRTISFELKLSRMMKPIENRTFLEKVQAGGVYPDQQSPMDVRGYNVDIRNQIAYLRAYCYPTYLNIEGVVVALPPPIAILNVPSMGLNESGGDAIFVIMTGCDVTYTLLFPDGTPRMANVSLTFKQIVQRAEGILFKGHGSGAPAKYALPDSNVGAKNLNSGRKTSGPAAKDVK